MARGARPEGSRATARRSSARSPSPPATSMPRSSVELAPVANPFPFGHECVGEVTEVGDSVKSVKPGDLVSVPFQVSCGSCAACREGRSGNCESVPRLSMYGLPVGPQSYGGFASDAVNVPYADAMLVPIPEGVAPAAVASLSDNIPDAWRTVAGPLGECARVAGPDRDGRRLDRALFDRDRAGSGRGARRRRRRPRARPRAGRSARRERPRRGVPGPGRLLSDHRRRERRPRRDRLRAAVDRRGRDLHQHRDLLPADSAAPARHVHPGDHLRHRPAPRPPADARRARAGPPGQVRSRPDDGEQGALGRRRRGALGPAREDGRGAKSEGAA